MSELVLINVADAVATLTLNRPERLNAWTREMARDYFALLRECGDDPSVRAIVVTGAGRGFCAGADASLLEDVVAGGAPLSSDKTPQWLATLIPKPVIAAVNGPCAGMGLIQALFCDIRFASELAKFASSFVRRGLIAEHGTSWTLPRAVGTHHAMDILLSGRAFLADEAVRMGLVNRVYPADELLDSTRAYARDLARYSSPAAMAVIKDQVWNDPQLDLPSAVRRSDELLQECLQWPDFGEGVASFAEKRQPAFPPWPRSS